MDQDAIQLLDDEKPRANLVTVMPPSSDSPPKTPLVLAGEPQRLGGVLASGLGWFFLLSGASISAFLTWVSYYLLHTAELARWVALPILVLTALAGGGSLMAGRRLKKRGLQSKREAQVSTLRVGASARGGALTVKEAAQLLRVPEAQADALLTELAIQEKVQQELTDQGGLVYRFERLRVAPMPVRAPSVGASQAGDIEELEAILEPPPGQRKRGVAG
jgi:hypothetical protein